MRYSRLVRALHIIYSYILQSPKRMIHDHDSSAAVLLFKDIGTRRTKSEFSQDWENNKCGRRKIHQLVFLIDLDVVVLSFVSLRLFGLPISFLFVSVIVAAAATDRIK